MTRFSHFEGAAHLIISLENQVSIYLAILEFHILYNNLSSLIAHSIMLQRFLPILFIFVQFNLSIAQETEVQVPVENDYYKIIKVPIPEGIILEVGGLAVLPDGSLAASTRRGDVWIIENPYGVAPTYRKFATGLHEILGLVWKDGALYCAQRGELTKLIDRNGDRIADRYETVYAWPISGHYHEYSFGPKLMPDGSFMVTGNVSFGSTDWWAGKSIVPWRGWAMQIYEDGTMKPFAAGMRSPCGIGEVDGDFFYGDNQGDWMGSGFITHVEKGDFCGHPSSLAWADRPESPVAMRKNMVFAKIDPRDNPNVKPEYIKDEYTTTLYELGKNNPAKGIKSPSVWLPHGVLGVSTSEIITDDANGAFGPFAGQVFVGDQGMSKIARVFLEKVNGAYQGASFDFRSGFRSGVLRMIKGTDNNLFVGGTNRGWGSTGKEPYSLERLVWTGQVPFEMKAVRAMPDGFEIEFTQAVQRATAENLDNYYVTGYTYKYHPVYGSPIIDFKEHNVLGARASSDGMRVRIVVDSLRAGYIHAIQPNGVRSVDGNNLLLHNTAYYTLNAIPSGNISDIPRITPKPKVAEVEMPDDAGMAVNTPDNQMKEGAPGGAINKAKPTEPKPGKKATPKTETKPAAPAVDEKAVVALLNKHTCTSCHKTNERAVGPSFADIAKRKYSTQKIVSLVQNPQPQNWPDYTPMAPMAHVPKKDIEKIAVWINTLRK
jgi:cytochrome c551/c552